MDMVNKLVCLYAICGARLPQTLLLYTLIMNNVFQSKELILMGDVTCTLQMETEVSYR